MFKVVFVHVTVFSFYLDFYKLLCNFCFRGKRIIYYVLYIRIWFYVGSLLGTAAMCGAAIMCLLLK